MNPKTTVGLVIALVIAVVGVWWAQSDSATDAPEPNTGPRPLFDMSAMAVTGFEVKSGSASGCSFKKQDEKWEMTSPIRGPGEQGTISSDVSTIANLKYVTAFGTSDPDRPIDEMTSLGSPQCVVKLTDRDDKSYVLKIGARQKLSTKTYVQKEGDDAIYLVDVDLNKRLHRSLSDYRGKQVSQYNAAEATRIEILGEQNYSLVKNDRKWTIETPLKARADQAAVGKLLQAVSGMTVSSFVDDGPKTLRPYGLDPARLVVAVTTEKKTPKKVEGPPASGPAEPEYDVTTRTIRVAFGGSAEKTVFAKLDDPDSPAVFQVADDVLTKVGLPLGDLRDKKIADIQTAQAQRITVTRGGNSIELVKEGTDWKIASSMKGVTSDVAEFAAVDDLLKAIGQLKALGFEDTELPTFGLESPHAVLEVSAEGKLSPVRLLVGGLTPSKTGAYIKNQGEDFIAAVSADSAASLAVDLVSFLSREVQRFDRSQASSLEVLRGGTTRTVQRVGSTWRFASPVQGAAEATAVGNILSDLSNLRGRRVVALASEAASYGLDIPAVRVTTTVQPPAKPAPTTTSAPENKPVEPSPQPTFHTVLVSRHGDKVYAMKSGGATICEVDGKVLDDLEAELLDTRVLSLQPSQGRRLSVSGETKFVFSKEGDQWTLEGESSFQTDPAKLTEIMTALSNLRAKYYTTYLGADLSQYGLDRPETVINVESDDGETASLLISAQGPADGGRYACVSAVNDRVFVIKAEDLPKLQKKPGDFHKAG